MGIARTAVCLGEGAARGAAPQILHVGKASEIGAITLGPDSAKQAQEGFGGE
jgi:hypothetical protein